MLIENITRSRSRPTCKRQSEGIFFAPCGKVSVCHHLGRPLPSPWLRTWAIKKYHCYHALTLSLSSPEISSVSFSLLQSFPIAFDVWIWKCRVRYNSTQSINRRSIYRLSPYRKILICRHVDCLLIARLSPIKILKSHSPSTPLLFHFHSFNFEYDRTIGSSIDTSVVFR